ncbi:hypothetical protein BJ508DRAFT_332204 [Ascobolus immersus RN42]|uniref:Uncharacterized protein n=1 Tax=Ascobolus immersus RN42 TaxID=1160509 RepID=A0A3N4I0A5_ASCIM|nr:hypothetical protein BJ508DRAFT_332204 [Ascobolus immersus RN42]
MSKTLEVYGYIKEVIDYFINALYRDSDNVFKIKPSDGQLAGSSEDDAEDENMRFLVEKVFPIIEDMIQSLQMFDPEYIDFVEKAEDSEEFEFDDHDPKQLWFKTICEVVDRVVELYATLIHLRTPLVECPGVPGNTFSGQEVTDYEIWKVVCQWTGVPETDWNGILAVHWKALGLFDIWHKSELCMPSWYMLSYTWPGSPYHQPCRCPEHQHVQGSNIPVTETGENSVVLSKGGFDDTEYRLNTKMLRNVLVNEKVESSIDALEDYITSILDTYPDGTASGTDVSEEQELSVYSRIKQETNRTARRQNPSYRPFIEAAHAKNLRYFDEKIKEQRVFKVIYDAQQELVWLYAEVAKLRLPFVELADGQNGPDCVGLWNEVWKNSRSFALWLHESKASDVFGELPRMSKTEPTGKVAAAVLKDGE